MKHAGLAVTVLFGLLLMASGALILMLSRDSGCTETARVLEQSGEMRCSPPTRAQVAIVGPNTIVLCVCPAPADAGGAQ